MTIKEFATERGVSTQAIYKRLKAIGKRAEDITEKGTGQLTTEGEAIVKSFYASSKVEKQENSLKACQLQVETLTREKTDLQRTVERLEAQVTALTDERDFLRKALTHSQEMEGIRARLDVLEAGQKVTQAITDGSSAGGLRGWWARIRGKT